MTTARPIAAEPRARLVFVVAAAAAFLGGPAATAARGDEPVPPPHGGRIAAAKPRDFSTIDGRTRWTFRAISPVTVHTPIVRLGDVARPMHPDRTAWSRLSRSPVGLVPIDGKPMTIERERLARAVQNAAATPAWIRWNGPETIEVYYRPEPRDGAPGDEIPNAQSSGGVPGTRTASYRPASNRPPTGRAANAAAGTSETRSFEAAANVDRIDPRDSDRIAYWITAAIRRQHDELTARFEIEVPRRQPGLSRLATARSISHVEFLDTPATGDCRARVTGRTPDGPRDVTLKIRLTSHPMAISPRRPLRRGHRIGASDLVEHPVPEAQWNEAFVTRSEELVGMEVTGSLRPGRPISMRDVRRPLLIRRGDLVEVRVMGGGVTVTTGGRAKDEGSERDLIQVETLDPKRQLVARVVAAGLVEVISRVPKVPR